MRKIDGDIGEVTMFRLIFQLKCCRCRYYHSIHPASNGIFLKPNTNILQFIFISLKIASIFIVEKLHNKTTPFIVSFFGLVIFSQSAVTNFALAMTLKCPALDPLSAKTEFLFVCCYFLFTC